MDSTAPEIASDFALPPATTTAELAAPTHSHDCASSHDGGHHHHDRIIHDAPLGGADADSPDDDAERDHFSSVILAFREYEAWFSAEIRRREAHYNMLSPADKARLPSGVRLRFTPLRVAAAANQALLTAIADEQMESGFGPTLLGEGAASGPHAAAELPPLRSSASHHSKVRSTLHQLARDWSEEGAAERRATYGPLLAELRRLLPVTPATRNRLRVLVPGCGTGRLAWECCREGYAACGNEFSYFMLFASHLVLNGTDAAGAHRIYPWIHDPSNHLRFEDSVRCVPIPDVAPSSALLAANPDADFSMVAGDFVSLYSRPSQRGQWDAVVTCFFLDTAPVVTEYIDAIHACLKPGGLWINAGPLLYHWQSAAGGGDDDGHAGADDGVDARYRRSVELPYADVRHAILASGFSLAREAVAPKSTYAANARSLMQVVYSPLLFTAVKDGGGAAAVPAAGGMGSAAPASEPPRPAAAAAPDSSDTAASSCTAASGGAEGGGGSDHTSDGVSGNGGSHGSGAKPGGKSKRGGSKR